MSFSFHSVKSPDLLVIGAGVFGLWSARHALQEGRSVLVLDKRRVGEGASGGPMGVLSPHMPDRWNPRKQFQFEALVSLESALRALEEDVGISCGYRRCGRWIPIRSESTLPEVSRRIEGSRARWPGFRMEHVALDDLPAGWLSEEVAPFGVQWDDLSARLDPPALLSALSSFARSRGELREGVEVSEIHENRVRLRDGTIIEAGEVCVAAGWEAYELLRPLTDGNLIGRGVKGQALLLSHAHDDDLPILYRGGVYVVPHEGNRVAIGSTSRDEWNHPTLYDPDDEEFYAQALSLAPSLSEAPILRRWAGVRPRNTLDNPPSQLNLRIGGFKTGIAQAHVKGLRPFTIPTRGFHPLDPQT